MESLALGVGSLGTWMILFCERAWPERGVEPSAVLARLWGALLSLPSDYPFLTAAKMEAYHWLLSSLPAPHFRPLWEPQKSGTWCPGNMMSVRSFGICFKLSVKISTILGGGMGGGVSTVLQLAGWG